MNETKVKLLYEMAEAEHKAWDSLARYKFQMFGYWCAIWVHLNKIGEFKRPNPWASLVKQAKPMASVSKRKLPNGNGKQVWPPIMQEVSS